MASLLYPHFSWSAFRQQIYSSHRSRFIGNLTLKPISTRQTEVKNKNTDQKNNKERKTKKEKGGFRRCHCSSSGPLGQQAHIRKQQQKKEVEKVEQLRGNEAKHSWDFQCLQKAWVHFTYYFVKRSHSYQSLKKVNQPLCLQSRKAFWRWSHRLNLDWALEEKRDNLSCKNLQHCVQVGNSRGCQWNWCFKFANFFSPNALFFFIPCYG